MAAVFPERPVQAQTVSIDIRFLTGEAVSVSLVLAAALLIRLLNLHYNTAFVDEAIYIVNGQQALRGTSGFVALNYMFGSYLYPVVAALFGYVTGAELWGARLLSALASTGAILAVYLATRPLLQHGAALLAAVVFGFAGASVFVGRLATYDVLGIALLAASLALLVHGFKSQDAERRANLFFYASVSIALSFLSKYIVAVFAPLFLLLGLGLLVQRRCGLLMQLLKFFVLPAAAILAAYGVLFADKLALLFVGVSTYASQASTLAEIRAGLQEVLLLPAGVAAVGAVLLLRSRGAEHRAVAGLCLLGGALLPAYHLYSQNIRSMDKHLVYALLFLAPLAGWALHRFFWPLQRRLPPRWRVAFSTGLAIACMAGSLQLFANQTDAMEQNWPHAQETVDFLATLPLDEESFILAEGAPTYNLYLNWSDNVQFIDTWSTFFTYKEQAGEAAMEQAIREQFFDYLVFDSYYTRDLTYQLETAAQAAGYRVAHSDSETIAGGATFVIRVYAASSKAEQDSPS